MPSTSQRYPLATPDGISIPLDIIKPKGIMFQAVSSVVSASRTLDSTIEIVSFIATVDCIVRFGGDASIPADGTILSDALFLHAGMRVTVAPPSASFTVIRYGSFDGVLAVQQIDKWAGLALQTQYARR